MGWQVSPIEIVMVLVIALLVFGPTRLPEMARQAGRSIREFKSTIEGAIHDDQPMRPGEPLPAVSTSVSSSDDVLEGVLLTGELPEEPGKPAS